jgi:hypothetical protein
MVCCDIVIRKVNLYTALPIHRASGFEGYRYLMEQDIHEKILVQLMNMESVDWMLSSGIWASVAHGFSTVVVSI